MNKACLVIFFLIALLLIATNSYGAPKVLPKVLNYTDIRTDGGITIIREKGELIAGHVSMPMTFCDDKSFFHCFSAPGFAFAVPAKFDKRESKHWSFDGVDYQVVERRFVLTMLGTSIEVNKILATIDENEFVYYYSEIRGLIAFSVNKKDSLFILQERCGIGATNACDLAPP